MHVHVMRLASQGPIGFKCAAHCRLFRQLLKYLAATPVVRGIFSSERTVSAEMPPMGSVPEMRETAWLRITRMASAWGDEGFSMRERGDAGDGMRARTCRLSRGRGRLLNGDFVPGTHAERAAVPLALCTARTPAERGEASFHLRHRLGRSEDAWYTLTATIDDGRLVHNLSWCWRGCSLPLSE